MSLRMKAAIVCNCFVAAMTVIAVLIMVGGLAAQGASLTSSGIWALKYFTVLSNIFSGVVSAIFAIALIRGRGRVGQRLYRLKLMATGAVAVTFFTVVVLFMGIFHLGDMFLGANFWFHLVLPVVSMLEFCLLDTDADIPLRKTPVALIPTAVYGIAYYANILINGIGEWPDTNDWYAFLAFGGVESAPIVFAIMLAGTWIIALVMWGINRIVGSLLRARS